MSSEDKLYLYPLWLRIWHGINALGIILLIITGVRMQYADLKFLGFQFQDAVTMHNYAGVLVSLNYLVFLFGNLLTENKKFYKIKLKGLPKRMKMQINYYLSGIFKDEAAPFPISEKRKFNPLQKYAYVVVMFLFVPVLIVTGLALLFPESIIENVYSFSGIFLTALLHISMGYLISIFLLVHLYVASIGKNPLDNFKSIINGYHNTVH
ncbi:cytochrome b/b6 domain-containing protein [Gaoshiqia sp. Z1-71]|uniref:cytochrome b/b6 domain-containing protein n=1 Tax=Gaoshiqia hydrogeniformans TaxID=3290090 RepID=UPI003BF831C9